MTNEYLLPALDAVEYLRAETAEHFVKNKKLRHKETAIFFRNLLISYMKQSDSLWERMSEDFWEED